MNESPPSPLEAVASSPLLDHGWYRVEPYTIDEANHQVSTSSSEGTTTIRFRWQKPTSTKIEINNTGKSTTDDDDDLALAKDCPLQPSWKMLLFGDGSPTKLLGILTGSRLTIHLLSMEMIYPDDQGTYPNEPIECTTLLRSPLIRRKVWLMNERSERLGYAVSWWNKDDSEAFLLDKNRPIGGNMATSHLDVYREVVAVQYGTHPELEKYFTTTPPLNYNEKRKDSTVNTVTVTTPTLSTGLWCRYYLMWRNGKPLNLIYEVFSPCLEKYMGPYTSR